MSKFLNSLGLTYLTRLFNEKYISPEVLTTIIDAIDTVKLNKDELYNLVYPIGSLYLSINNINPTSLFGGKWEQINDSFLLSSGQKYQLGLAGGQESIKLTLNNLPMYTTDNEVEGYGLEPVSGFKNRVIVEADTSEEVTIMPPYLVVNIWKRVE